MDWAVLVPVDGSGVQIALDLADTPVLAGRPRLHLDFYAKDQSAEVDRLLSLGATWVERDSSAWSPRDALIRLLREIDNSLNVRAFVVTMAINLPDGTLGHGFRNACPDNFTALGLLARASHRLQE